MTRPTKRKRGRKVFFLTVYATEDCVTPIERHELIFASRLQAKKAARAIRARCFEWHGAKIEAARQDDLRFTGWTVIRSGGRRLPPEYHPYPEPPLAARNAAAPP